MNNNSQIQLSFNRIAEIPFQAYEEDFTFIVNNREFRTSHLVSELLSPTICRMRSADAAMNTFTIRTEHQGDFQLILNLINFQQNSIPETEMPFFVEVIQILGISSDNIVDQNQQADLNDENIFELTRRHERFEVIYSNVFNRDIDYIASNFFRLCETKRDEMNNLLPQTLERIVSNNRLKLKNEDQLFKFINQVYQNSNANLNYSKLYHYVLFSNVEDETMASFIDNFDFNDFDREIWTAISNRLKFPIIQLNDEQQNTRYEESNGKIFHPQHEDGFVGIMNYLRSQSNGNIANTINITASSCYNSSYPPTNLVNYENRSSIFYSQNTPNSWICFDFKQRNVIPFYYQIMTFNCYYPKSWVIEGSNDNSNWTILDEQNNCQYLNTNYKVHIFKISNPNQFRYIKMRLTGPNWGNNNHFYISSFELYGKLISKN